MQWYQQDVDWQWTKCKQHFLLGKSQHSHVLSILSSWIFLCALQMGRDCCCPECCLKLNKAERHLNQEEISLQFYSLWLDKWNFPFVFSSSLLVFAEINYNFACAWNASVFLPRGKILRKTKPDLKLNCDDNVAFLQLLTSKTQSNKSRGRTLPAVSLLLRRPKSCRRVLSFAVLLKRTIPHQF